MMGVEYPWGKGRTLEQYAAAMADRPAQHWPTGVCDARGPGGNCCRKPGHSDTANGYHHNLYGNDHWSWDSDHFEHWPVGWKDDSDWLEQADELLRETRIFLFTVPGGANLYAKIDTFLKRPK